jgi:uncharacterized protein YkwD
MLARRTAAVLAAVGAAAASASPASAASCKGANDRLPRTTATAQARLPAVRATIACLVNRQRSKHGLRRWRRDARVGAAAQARADDLVARNYFSHHAPDGRDASTELRAQGYAFRKVGENLVRGYNTPAQVVRAWLRSPGHRAILLDRTFTAMGSGVAFGHPLSASDSRSLVLYGVLLAAKPKRRR